MAMSICIYIYTNAKSHTAKEIAKENPDAHAPGLLIQWQKEKLFYYSIKKQLFYCLPFAKAIIFLRKVCGPAPRISL